MPVPSIAGSVRPDGPGRLAGPVRGRGGAQARVGRCTRAIQIPPTAYRFPADGRTPPACPGTRRTARRLSRRSPIPRRRDLTGAFKLRVESGHHTSSTMSLARGHRCPAEPIHGRQVEESYDPEVDDDRDEVLLREGCWRKATSWTTQVSRWRTQSSAFFSRVARRPKGVCPAVAARGGHRPTPPGTSARSCQQSHN